MPEWIKDNKNNIAEADILNDAKILNGEYKYIAFFTNKISGGNFIGGAFAPEITDTAHLLELRVFNCEREFKAVRTQIGKSFKWRIADEINVDKELYVSETQLLDIDTKKMEDKNLDGTFIATGGGEYVIPAEPDCDSVELINYIKYDDYGNIQFVDFRIKRFFKEV